MRRITQRDIAREAGVSQETVSQVLRGVGRIREETRERILSTAGKLGYQANPLAQSMRMGRCGILGLLHDEGVSPFLEDLHDSVTKRGLSLRTWRVSLGKCSEEPEVWFQRVVADGILVQLNQQAPLALRMALKSSPAIWVDAPQPHNSVQVDEREIAQRLAKDLASGGFQRICLLHPPQHDDADSQNYALADHHAGCEEFCAQTEIALESISTNELNHEWVRSTTSEGRPALICSDRNLALRSILIARDCRIRVPEDLLIAYFGSAPFWDWDLDYQLKLIRRPTKSLAEGAVEAVLTRITAPDESIPSRHIPYPPDTLNHLLA